MDETTAAVAEVSLQICIELCESEYHFLPLLTLETIVYIIFITKFCM